MNAADAARLVTLQALLAKRQNALGYEGSVKAIKAEIATLEAKLQ